MRRDIESDLVHSFNTSDAARVAQTGAASRSFGGYQSFINSADTCVSASGSTAPTFSSNSDGRDSITYSAAPTLGSLSLADIDQVMQMIYEEGGKASKIMLSPKLRRDFSDLMVTDSGAVSYTHLTLPTILRV